MRTEREVQIIIWARFATCEEGRLHFVIYAYLSCSIAPNKTSVF